jgi:undecaprenyl-diphosphatase
VAAISFSRIALGVHYLSDVVAGILVGVAWFIAMTAAFTAWRIDEHGQRADHGGLEQHARSEDGTQPPE